MSRCLSFVYLDGREIEASSPREVFEALRTGEPGAPADLGRHLDLLYSRGILMFSVVLDVGATDGDLDARCRQALASLLRHGWLRIKRTEPTWPPRRRRPVPASKAAPPSA